jgi:hypothetical protein
LYPFAPAGVLGVVRPHLPAWLPVLLLRGLRVVRAVVDMEFARDRDGSTSWMLTRAEGPISVVSAPPPLDTIPGTSGATDRLARWVMDHAPGRRARALRIALGREAG